MAVSAIYLDNNAATRVAPACIDAVLYCLRETWGNPSSKHRCGEQAHRVVLEARVRVAASIGATPSEVMFTSVRFSLASDNTEGEIDRVLEILPPLIAQIAAAA